ncbi:4-(cytidine 5'-diphospho)-2-C-methyl-D-erythritol kinase [Cetobacterium somerae]|uniref:4-diphosphocytidyl-2-C-methyl-D-erythritol kinase n=1 Tax=Cetobacterium somerae ATCC BAA-474 TaxID=1319815 RepID=U7VD06_9FUSO|nr:4-(cytidine 5'-diphospho)-2-C-methyl-D-erythritol kinase [Cetobacterium somerae]ERT69607.1 4-(cytidine 5'-diphospho)-2-C-methyl-D-erythritol kinase [Cetobacterium somerae ATCC BAA-474]MCQ9627401.1 4-(cytidine 5'-diphospho)-2-C-methyl-D-erythritol kinase [Cetobacterium somerae]WVJ00841.1 4-(cytidine 5'-diphospho)-2-C-methyl-D-erythritol kinase [Cetobacterium somerae]
MKIFNLQSNAKINIGLNIVGVLENGYHLLDMTMIPIDLCDNLIIKVEDKSGDLKIKTNKKDIPVDSSNILYKIYIKFYEKVKLAPLSMEVFLEKIIPHQAGLGGGSSNGAIFLNFLNKFHGNILSFGELVELGKSIGADIPFFILNKPSRVQGIGEKLQEIENNLKVSLVIIKPPFGVSTVEAYKQMKNIDNPRKSNIDNIIQGLKENDLSLVEEYIENNLEEALLKSDKNLIEFRNKLKEVEELKFFMSGSGSAFYAFLIEDIDEKISKLRHRFNDCEIFLCNFK